MNLLYDHSLTPLRSRPKDTDGGKKTGYPGEDDILTALETLGAERISNAPAIYELGKVHFQFRYNSGGKNKGFGELSEDFLNWPHPLLIAIRKGSGNCYSWVRVRLDAKRDYTSGSWSINGGDAEAGKWSKFLPPSETNKKIAEEIADAIAKISGEVNV